MAIVISTVQLQIIYAHTEDIYPEEACGILIGKIENGSKNVIEVVPTNNAWEKPELDFGTDITDTIGKTKHSRYTIAPQDIFQAQKRARNLQLDIIGFFHSHPDYPAIPSDCDRSQAWEIYSYPIVSVVQGKVSDLQSWVLDREGVFQLEQIKID
jgi:proteasome lid subunit RPN8/RPN11